MTTKSRTNKILLADDYPLPTRAITESIAIMGRKGSGKTYTGGRLFEQMHGIGAQVVALDPVGKWWGLRLSKSGKRRGLDIPVFGGEHGDIPVTPEGGKLMANVVVERRLSCVVDLMDFRKNERKKFVTDFAEELFHLKKRHNSPLHLFLEEARKFIPQKPFGPDEMRMIGAFEDIVRLGRNYGLGVSLLDQRPQSVNKEVLSQTELLIVHQLTGKHERKEIEAWVREKATKGEESLSKLDELQPGECFFWSPGLMRTFARIKVGPKATYDASATPELGEAAAEIEAKPLSDAELQALQQSMSEVIEQVEARDPKKLQAQVRKKDATIKNLEAKVKLLEQELEERPDEVEVEVKVERVEVVTTQDILRIQAVGEEVTEAIEPLMDLLKKVHAVNEKAPAPVNGAPSREVPPGLRPLARATAEQAANKRLERNARNSLISKYGGSESGDSDLSGPEQRILNALAWLESIGVDEPELAAVAFLAGYKVGGGAFNNPRGRLRSKGLVDYRPGKRMVLTDAGRAAADPPSTPLTTEDLHDAVLARLGGPEQRILKPLLDAYPKELTNEQLAAAAGYTAGAGAFNNPRGRLRSLGLIEYPQPGHVAARNILFLAS